MLASTDLGKPVSTPAYSLPISVKHVAPAVHVADFAIIVAAGAATGSAYRLLGTTPIGDIDQFAATGPLVALLIVGVNALCGVTRTDALLDVGRQVRSLGRLWLLAGVLVLGLAFAWKVPAAFSPAAYLTFFSVGLILTAGSRVAWSVLLKNAMDAHRLKTRRAAVLYPADIDRQEIRGALGDLRRHGLMPFWQIAWPPNEGEAARQMSKILRGTDVAEVVVLFDWRNAPDLIDLEQFSRLPVPVRLLPVGAASAVFARSSEMVGDSVLIDVQRGPLSEWERLLKASFDKVVAASALLILAPFLALCAVLIKLESGGPVFFRQTRLGFNGRPFDIWKFRTMSIAENGRLVTQAVVGDPRVTRVGRWLRRASVDELPQLINVVRGEMSIVGPRPHAVAHDDFYDRLIADYARRQHVRPGLTGWAQVRGARGATPTVEHMQRRVDLDLWYVQNWSFRLDIWIVICTAWHVVTTRNAY